MKTFLVPVDFSSVADAVIDSSISFAKAFGGKAILLHVVQPPVVVTGEYALPVEMVQETVAAAEASAQAKLAERQKAISATGLECAPIVRHGAPIEVILEVASEASADFIIMGSHGHGKLYDFFVGSTASGVIKKAKCGVIIIPQADKDA